MSVIITLWEMSNTTHHMWTIMIPIFILEIAYCIKLILNQDRDSQTANKFMILMCFIAQSILIVVNVHMELNLPWRIAFIPTYAALGALFLNSIRQTQRQSWFENSRKIDENVRLAIGDACIAILGALVIFLLGSYLDWNIKANYTVFLFGAIWLAVATGLYLMRIGKWACGLCNPSIEFLDIE